MKDCYLADAYKDVPLAKKCIGDARKDENWDKVWVKIGQISLSVRISVSKPRTVSVQRHRANSSPTFEGQTPSDN